MFGILCEARRNSGDGLSDHEHSRRKLAPAALVKTRAHGPRMRARLAQHEEFHRRTMEADIEQTGPRRHDGIVEIARMPVGVGR